jgi:hypothetical protein
LARTAAIEVRFSINFAVFDFNAFPFPPSKPKLIGDVPMNRQNVAARRIFFFLFCTAQCLLTQRIILRHQAMRGDPEKKIRKIKFENYRRCKFGPQWPLPIGARMHRCVNKLAQRMYAYP